MKDLKQTSVFISLILRHKPDAIGISLDRNGWASVEELINGINKTDDYIIDMQALEEIVNTDLKNRFTFNFDKTMIRANQGHSINVDVQLKEAVPPEQLYHGTSERAAADIRRQGIKSMKRLYVHLSKDKRTAEIVGSRHGKPYVFLINSGKMYRAGYNFYLSENGVWLTKYVPPEFLGES